VASTAVWPEVSSSRSQVSGVALVVAGRVVAEVAAALLLAASTACTTK
jgi:hypothetical protein